MPKKEESRPSVDEYCEGLETKMRGGVFSVIVLFLIDSFDAPVHGYRMTKMLAERSGGALRIQAGTLYPILKNLEANGLVVHEMVRSTEGPERKVYTITRDGRKALARLLRSMDGLSKAIDVIRGTNWKDKHEDRR